MRGNGGGRQLKGLPVKLNVYDISDANKYGLHDIGLGLYHTGLEISGTEWTFGQGGGIGEMSPKTAPGAEFRETIALGEFQGTHADVRGVVSDLRGEFQGDDYNIVTKNCNVFSNELCLRLLGKPIPAHINRLASIGSCCSCLFPAEMLGTDPTSEATGSGSHAVFGGGGRTLNSSNKQVKTSSFNSFAGAGHSLGGSTNSSTGTNADERRLKMRAAALARMQAYDQQPKKQE